MLGTPPRRYDAEIMDRPDNARADLETAFAAIRRVNRWLGGRRCLLEAVRPWLRPRADGEPLRVLDVGTGDADLPLALLGAAREAGVAVDIVALDFDPRTAAIAAERVARRGAQGAIRVVRADAMIPPFRAGSFHLVTASLFLHHFHELEVVRMLHGLAAVASEGVVVNDLRRHRVPYWFMRTLCAVVRPHPMFAHDAPLSVLRGFTERELAWAAHQASTGRARVERRWPFRLLLSIDTAGSA